MSLRVRKPLLRVVAMAQKRLHLPQKPACGGRVESAGCIAQDERQLFSPQGCQQGQWIVGLGASVLDGSTSAFFLLPSIFGARWLLEGEVLEQHQALEQGHSPGHARSSLHLNERAVFVLLHLDLAAPASARSHARTLCSPSSRTRTGSELMNSPTIDSTPVRAGGRPENVEPKTTSSCPE